MEIMKLLNGQSSKRAPLPESRFRFYEYIEKQPEADIDFVVNCEIKSFVECIQNWQAFPFSPFILLLFKLRSQFGSFGLYVIIYCLTCQPNCAFVGWFVRCEMAALAAFKN